MVQCYTNERISTLFSVRLLLLFFYFLCFFLCCLLNLVNCLTSERSSFTKIRYVASFYGVKSSMSWTLVKKITGCECNSLKLVIFDSLTQSYISIYFVRGDSLSTFSMGKKLTSFIGYFQ